MNNLSLINQIIIVFISQLIMIYARTLNVRTIIAGHTFWSIANGFVIQITWLLGSAFSINALLQGSWLVVLSYIIGGGLGTYLSMKTNIHK